MATVLIAGGTGLIGSHLSQLLDSKGYTVLHLSRSPKPDAEFKTYHWDTEKHEIDEEAVERADFVVNFAGAGIADQRWTESRKRLIIDSRVKTNELLSDEFQRQGKQPKAYLSASAIGYYGDRGEQWVTETATPGEGFLPVSVVAWEKVLQEIQSLGWRTVIIRIGIVLSEEGGALERMLLPLKFFTSAYFGDGRQYYSWVHIDDLCRMFLQGIENESMDGTYNGVAPHPVPNKDFAEALANASDRSALVVPAPAFVLRMAMGEMADVVLTGARVSSKKIEGTGFTFNYPSLDKALENLV